MGPGKGSLVDFRESETTTFVRVLIGRNLGVSRGGHQGTSRRAGRGSDLLPQQRAQKPGTAIYFKLADGEQRTTTWE